MAVSTSSVLDKNFTFDLNFSSIASVSMYNIEYIATEEFCIKLIKIRWK